MQDFETTLKKTNFEKRLKKLEKKLNGKRIVIYGAGSFFQYIIEHYDLSKLNIIGISDLKFVEEQNGEKYLNYEILTKNKMAEIEPDAVLIATENYMNILEDFAGRIFRKSKTKVYPLVAKSLWANIKQIWS